jgi:hypothetical protein
MLQSLASSSQEVKKLVMPTWMSMSFTCLGSLGSIILNIKTFQVFKGFWINRKLKFLQPGTNVMTLFCP